jgi:protein-L-isoaspartate(D-aspartate) O-methyltransferase
LLANILFQGVGMTSERTRERMIQRLIDQGIVNVQVLERMRQTPRHLFLDEALSHRAYRLWADALAALYCRTHD